MRTGPSRWFNCHWSREAHNKGLHHSSCRRHETTQFYRENMMKKEQLQELLYQALETEAGGVQVYETAVRCAINDDLKEEWEKYLEQTRTHERTMRSLLESMGLGSGDGNAGTAGRQAQGRSLSRGDENGPQGAATPTVLNSWPRNAWSPQKPKTTKIGSCSGSGKTASCP